MANSGAHSERALTAVKSPSYVTCTIPAGTRNVRTGVPRLRSHQEAPTVGWPAKGSSMAGV